MLCYCFYNVNTERYLCPQSESAFNPSLCRLSPFHLALCRCFKAIPYCRNFTLPLRACFRREGYPCARPLPQQAGQSLLWFTSKFDILCNCPKFKIILKSLIFYGKHVKFRKIRRENIIIVDRKYLFILQMFLIKLRNWIIRFRLVRLLVTLDGGKLTRVGELSLAERFQGRQGNPLAGVTLVLSQGYPSARVTLPAL